jgi:phenylpropionate dioxygenase-like ring-hydroxylating dioxygenase large terminal subunit
MTNEVDVRPWIRDGAVHGAVYREPSVFEAEMSRIFRRTWVYVGHESEVASVGDYRTKKIGAEPVIVARGEDGVLRVLLNRCKHRAASVCQARAGNAKSFRCQYHGWTYRNTGRLVAVPYPDSYPEDLTESVHLDSLPRVETYEGLVFASFNPSVPPLRDYLGDEACAYISQFMNYSLSRRLVAAPEAHQVMVESNWKLQMENGLDGYHAVSTHRSFYSIMQQRMGQPVRQNINSDTARSRALGNGHSVLDPGAQDTAPLRARIAALPNGTKLVARVVELEGDNAQPLIDAVTGPGLNIGIFPNLQLIGIHIREIDPISVDRTVVTVRPLLLAEGPAELNALRMRYHELSYGPAGFVQPDDLEAFVRVREGLDATEDDWLSFRRGMTDEEHGVGASRSGRTTDEVPQRGQYRAWLELMVDDRPAR